MAAEIDSLQIKISANAQSAAASLKSLATALDKVKTSLSGMKKGFDAADRISKISSDVAKSFEEINHALDGISISGIAKLEELTKTLNSYTEALKNLKKTPDVNVSQKVKGLNSVLTPRKSKKSASGVTESDYTEEDFRSVGMGDEAVSSQKTEKVKDYSKAVKKAGEETKKAGKKAKEATGFFGKFIKSIGRILMYRAIRAALKAIGEAFTEGLKNAYQFSKQNETFTRLAETLDRVKSITSQMVNQIGAMWGEIRQFIMPAVEWLVEKVRLISEKITELIAALNGDSTYLRARYEAQEWEEATDKAKEYKHQLLGIDELNNLSAQKQSKKDEKDYSNLYDIVSVNPMLQKVGARWQELKKKISEIFNEIKETCLGEIGMLVLGVILLFTTHKLLGIGMIIGSGLLIAKKYDFNWDSIYKGIKQAFKKFKRLITVVSIGMAAIGTILLFVPTKRLVGLSMIIASGVLMAANIAFNGNDLYKDIKAMFKKYRKLITAVSLGMMAIGTILLFVPSKRLVGLTMIIESGLLMAANFAFNWDDMYADIKRAFKKYKKLVTGVAVGMAAVGTILMFIPSTKLIGISMLISSGVLMAANVAFNWSELYNAVKATFKKYNKLFAATAVGSVALGSLLLFVPGMHLVGLTMLIAGLGIGAADIGFNWDEILDKLKEAWTRIKNWWNSTVVVAIKKAIGWIEEKFHIDINGDGVKGYVEEKIVGSPSPRSTSSHSSTTAISGTNSTPSAKSTSTHIGTTTSGISNLSESVRNQTIQLEPYIFGTEYPGLVKKKKAMGGVVNGSLFWAGEQGAEFVGNIGTTSAVANTGQMTDAIYKAAYMGMSKALKENGGGGMSGYEPATMDDLFIAMRKKSNEYNMTKGASAFA